jgi:hypothetical protein
MSERTVGSEAEIESLSQLEVPQVRKSKRRNAVFLDQLEQTRILKLIQ